MNKLHSNSLRHAQEVDVPLPLEIHPSVSPLAAELLMKASRAITIHPERYDQSAPCGSVCCIIGWMEHFHGIISMTGGGLGLNWDQYISIFDYSKWPAVFDTPSYGSASKVPASVAVARIEHFLRTGQ